MCMAAVSLKAFLGTVKKEMALSHDKMHFNGVLWGSSNDGWIKKEHSSNWRKQDLFREEPSFSVLYNKIKACEGLSGWPTWVLKKVKKRAFLSFLENWKVPCACVCMCVCVCVCVKTEEKRADSLLSYLSTCWWLYFCKSLHAFDTLSQEALKSLKETIAYFFVMIDLGRTLNKEFRSFKVGFCVKI